MKVALIMGSDSDWPVVKAAAETFSDFEVEFEVTVASAHRTPEVVQDFVIRAKERGVAVIIAAAGAAAHLPGVVAAYTTLPVIGIPINATPLGGLDALLSIAQMPSGVPVACMAIGGAKNAALFALQILAIRDDSLNNKLIQYKARMKEEVAAKAQNLQKSLLDR